MNMKFWRVFDVGIIALIFAMCFYVGEKSNSLAATESRVDSLENDYKALVIQIHYTQLQLVKELGEIKADIKVLRQRQ